MHVLSLLSSRPRPCHRPTIAGASVGSPAHHPGQMSPCARPGPHAGAGGNDQGDLPRPAGRALSAAPAPTEPFVKSVPACRCEQPSCKWASGRAVSSTVPNALSRREVSTLHGQGPKSLQPRPCPSRSPKAGTTDHQSGCRANRALPLGRRGLLVAKGDGAARQSPVTQSHYERSCT
jgi:hypothetical protein